MFVEAASTSSGVVVPRNYNNQLLLVLPTKSLQHRVGGRLHLD